MEETVGLWWHQLISRLSSQRYPHAAATLEQQNKKSLGILFRALGGANGLSLDVASSRQNLAHRSWLERISGSGTRVEETYLDDQAMRLPAVLDLYPEAPLNQDLYPWLVAMGAVFPQFSDADEGNALDRWLRQNQRATEHLLANCAGLAARYWRLVDAELQRRGALIHYPENARPQETAIRQALLHPGSVAHFPTVNGTTPPPQAVLLWLHLAPLREKAEGSNHADSESTSGPTVQHDTKRRRAKDAGGPPRKGGLLLFRPESIFSWTEYARVEHEVQENEEQDLARAADDLDVISVSKDNTAVVKKLRMKLDHAERGDEPGSPPAQWLRVPEWDYRQQVLIPDHCAIQCLSRSDAEACALPDRLLEEQRRLHRQLSSIISQRQVRRAQPDGTDLDLDACIRQRSNPANRGENLYVDARKQQRDLACLLLADLSLSTDAALDGELRIIDVLRDSLLLFAESLATTRDRFAILGFNSRLRHDVRITEFKGFSEHYSGQVRRRILDASPGNYTRMGAAIRVATQKLVREPCREKLLLLLSDGKPNDADYYEGRYGVEDTRMALVAARKQGVRPFCITIDQESEDYLPHIFGKNGFAIVSRPRELPKRLTQLYAQLTHAQAR